MAKGANEIAVDTDAMRAAQKRAAASASELRAKLTEMYQSVEALNNTWQGGNSEQFRSTFQERYSTIERAVSEISAFLRVYQSAGDAYKTCESDVNRIIRN